MKSKASIKSHPLHPILIPFPIAFFTATLIVDLSAVFLKSDHLISFSNYLHLAAMASAVIAAIPGIIDYIYTVPPASSAKTRARKHGLLNSAALGLFIISYFLKGQTSAALIVLLELAGVISMVIAGWLGGTLIHRNLIGVDMRYANAGKWKEIYVSASEKLVDVAGEDELQTDEMILVHVGRKRIVVARTEELVVAFDDHCSHKGGSLAGGAMICGTVQCPWHGSQFDVCSGAVKAGPATESISTYPVELRNGRIAINLR